MLWTHTFPQHLSISLFSFAVEVLHISYSKAFLPIPFELSSIRAPFLLHYQNYSLHVIGNSDQFSSNLSSNSAKLFLPQGLCTYCFLFLGHLFLISTWLTSLYSGLKSSVIHQVPRHLNHSSLYTPTPITIPCFILLFSPLSSANVYLFLAWLPNTLRFLWVGDFIPVLFATLESRTMTGIYSHWVDQ